MSDHSKIEWTETTWNPITGCTPVSSGCDNCYARRFAERWRGIHGHPYERGFDLCSHEDRLELPLRWKKPRMVFVNSMGDLFHEKINLGMIQDVFDVMNRANRHTFQVLTKRASRMMALSRFDYINWTPNIWAGVSVESKDFLWRIDELREVPAHVRFVSFEPLLSDVGRLDLRDIHWVIVGGETGPGARSMEYTWAHNIIKQCEVAGVPFFFKKWGGTGKDKNCRKMNGREWNEMPKGARRDE